MKRKDALADKLIAGTATEASRSAAWWPRHSALVGAYVDALDSGAQRDPVPAVQNAKEWCVLIGDPHEFMLEHVALEVDLVDAAARPDPAAISKIHEAMELNIDKQRVWLSSRILDFPARRFEELMRDHIRLFLEAVSSKMDDDDRKLLLCSAKRGHNAVSLGALMTEWV